MSLPLISIVTPSYNQAEYLEQTILSVLNQSGRGTCFELEYIVMDGGSRDGSADIIRRYADELKHWQSERDGGQTAAINAGMRLVTGQIRGYINSDDYYLPGAFERVLELAASYPSADLIYGACQKVDAQGNRLSEQLSTITSLDDILNLWDVWLRPHHNLNFIQPEVFWTDRYAKQVGEFNDSLYYAMDFEYWLRGFASGISVARTDAPLAAFRVHAAQKTADRAASIRELMQVAEPYLREQASAFPMLHQYQQTLAHGQLFDTVCGLQNQSLSVQATGMMRLIMKQPSLWSSSRYWKQFRRALRGKLRAA